MRWCALAAMWAHEPRADHTIEAVQNYVRPAPPVGAVRLPVRYRIFLAYRLEHLVDFDAVGHVGTVILERPDTHAL